MKKIEAIIRPESLEKLKKILDNFSVAGMTITSVMGCGTQRGSLEDEEFKGMKITGMNLIPKIMAIMVVNDKDCGEILNSIHENLSTGQYGDGKVFVSTVDDVMRIRTGERGKAAT